AVSVRLRAIRGGNASGVEQVLDAIRSAVEWSTILAGGDLRVGAFCLGERRLPGQGDDGAKLRIELLDAFQIDRREPFRREQLVFDPLRQPRDPREGDISVVRWQWNRLSVL